MADAIMNVAGAPCTSDRDFEEAEMGAITVDGILAMKTGQEKCLLLNKVYQEFIRHTIQRLEIILEENLEQQELIREGCNVTKAQRNMLDVFKCKKWKWLATFRKPYFRNRAGFVQKPNEDAKLLSASRYIDPYAKAPRIWTAEEKETLRAAVSANALQLLLEPQLIRKQALLEKLNDPRANKIGIQDKSDECDKTIEDIKSMGDERLFSDQSKEYDWMTISNVTFEGRRTPLQCELMWKNHVSPNINTKKWTASEDEALERLIKLNCDDWDAAASNLGTKRTALQCFERYKLKFSKDTTNRTWTAENDETLRMVVEECRIGKFIPWHQVAYYCERTNQEVYRRWKYYLDPDLKRGKWTEIEDTCLVAGVMRYGENFAKISTMIPGRTNAQVRDRYHNSLRITISNSMWSLAEDNRLIKVVNSIGPKWCEVVTHFPSRTTQMVARRYRCLMEFREKCATSSTICEDERPKTVDRQTNKYRNMIYAKVVESLGKTPTNDKNPTLDGFMQKLEYELMNPPKKRLLPIKLEETFGAEDRAFIEYFMLTTHQTKTGRPFLKRKCDVSESECAGERCRIMETLSEKINAKEVVSPIAISRLVKSADCDVKKEFPINRSMVLAPCASTLRTLRFYSLVRQRLCEIPNTDQTPPKPITAEANRMEKWRLLARRFVTLFFMPALMAKVPMKEIKSEEEEVTPIKKRCNKLRKRKRKKPWVIGGMVRGKKDVENTVQGGENVSENGATEEKVVLEEINVINTVKVEENVVENDVTTKRSKRGRPVGAKMKVFPVSRRSDRIRSTKTTAAN